MMVDTRQEQTCCQNIATVCISNSQYLGFGGPWVSAVLVVVCKVVELVGGGSVIIGATPSSFV